MNWWNPFDWGEMMVEGVKTKGMEMLSELLKDVIVSSQYICIIGGLIGLILYLFGLKKGKTVASISPVIYIIIRILGSVMLGVK